MVVVVVNRENADGRNEVLSFRLAERMGGVVDIDVVTEQQQGVRGVAANGCPHPFVLNG